MKVVGLAAAMAVAAAQVSAGASAPFETAFSELNGCMVSLAVCGNEKGLAAMLKDKASCEAAGLKWLQRVQDADELEALATSAGKGRSMVGGRKVQVVKHRAGVSVAELSKQAAKAQLTMGDSLFCDESTYSVVDGTVSAVESLAGAEFAFVMPAVLKRSPALDLFTSAGLREDGVAARRVKLAPSLKGRAAEVAAKWTAERAARGRRLLEERGEDLAEVRFNLPRRVLNSAPAGEDDLVLLSAARPEDMDDVEEDPMVMWIERTPLMTTNNMDAVLLMQDGVATGDLEAPDAPDARAPLWQAGVKGQGEIVGVGDSGIDMKHVYFRDPNVDEVARIAIRQGNPNGTRYDYLDHRKVIQYVAHSDGWEGTAGGHGTHVAGTVAGNADPSEASVMATLGDTEYPVGYHKGMAPEAKIAFYDVGISFVDRFVFPPEDLADMFNPAYEVGARIHTNSWGDSDNVYDLYSVQADKFAYEHQDMVVLFANGNAGLEVTNPIGSLGSPAAAKNIISVGAAQNSNRTFAMMAPLRVGRSFQECGTPVTGQCADTMAFFTSTGPTYDGRIKPDVAGVGFWMISANSNPVNFTAELSGKGGTSMACPAAAGSAALVRQWFKEGRYPSGAANAADAFQPMGALVKAAMINGAEGLTGVQCTLDLKCIQLNGQDRSQGFGRVKLTNSLLLGGNAGVYKVYADGDMANMPSVSHKETVTYTFAVKKDNFAAGGGLRATLAWFDAPASVMSTKALVNDLDVRAYMVYNDTVVTEPVHPNRMPFPDSVNTVERIEIPGDFLLEDGKLVIEVDGFRVSVGNEQPYALVVSGGIEGLLGDPVSTGGIQSPGEDKEDEDDDDDKVLIIGGVVAGVLIVLAAAAAFCIGKSKGKKESNNVEFGRSGGPVTSKALTAKAMPEI